MKLKDFVERFSGYHISCADCGDAVRYEEKAKVIEQAEMRGFQVQDDEPLCKECADKKA